MQSRILTFPNPNKIGQNDPGDLGPQNHNKNNDHNNIFCEQVNNAGTKGLN